MTAKRYFLSHLKANIRPLIYLTIIVFALTVILALNGQPIFDYTDDGAVRDYKSTLYIPVVFICLLAYIVPVMEFAFFKKRKNLDFAYALPISRRDMGLVHYLSGLITVTVPFLVSYITNILFMLSRGSGYFDYSIIPLHFLLTIVFGLIMYSLFTFVFNKANTVGDGIWFIILYTFVLAIIVAGIQTVICESIDRQNDYDILAHANYPELFAIYGIPWVPIDNITTLCQNMVEMNGRETLSAFFTKPICLIYFIFWIAVGIASTLGFILSFGKDRMEKTEDISDTPFGFKVLIPIFAIFGEIWIVLNSRELILWLIVEILALVGYTVYRRGFRYKKSDVMILASLCLFLVLL